MNFALIKYRYSEDEPWITQLCTDDELEHTVNSKDDLGYLIDPKVRESYEEYIKSFVVLLEFETDMLNLSIGVDEYLNAK